jgi:hypothetical protein
MAKPSLIGKLAERPTLLAHNSGGFGEQSLELKLDISTTTTSSFILPGQFSRQILNHNVYRPGALQHFLGPDLGDRP